MVDGLMGVVGGRGRDGVSVSVVFLLSVEMTLLAELKLGVVVNVVAVDSMKWPVG